LYKYNLSNEEKKKILFLKEIYLKFEDKNLFTEDNLFKIFYLYGKDFLIDLIDFRLLTAKTINKKILDIKNLIIDSEKPILPIKARDLIKKYNLKEGRDLGKKLRKIEEVWINNKFKISDNEIDVIIKD
jgi:poly(A) polymerase